MKTSDTRIWTALVTPMDQSGKVDTDGLLSLIARQQEAGNGVLLLGSTGEGLALGLEEKKSVIEAANRFGPNVPVMAGVGGFNLEEQKRWIEWAGGKVDAFLLVAPLYAKPGPEGMKLWFRELLDASERPCMIYNIPSRSGVKIPPEVVQSLEGHSRLWALKESSGNLEEYVAFRGASPDLYIYSGDDKMMPQFARAGCQGLVSVASNVWPEAVGRYEEGCQQGKISENDEPWARAVELLFSAPNPIPAKALLAEKGWIDHAAVRLPLTQEESFSRKDLAEADRKIEEWFENLENQGE